MAMAMAMHSFREDDVRVQSTIGYRVSARDPNDPSHDRRGHTPDMDHDAVHMTSRSHRHDHTPSGRSYLQYRQHDHRGRAARLSANSHRRVGIRQIDCRHTPAPPDTCQDTILLAHHHTPAPSLALQTRAQALRQRPRWSRLASTFNHRTAVFHPDRIDVST